jgi:hypothetical protein
MPRDYADKLADAMGAGFDSCTAHTYAGGAFALWRLRTRRRSAASRLRFPQPGAGSNQIQVNPTKSNLWPEMDPEDEEEDERERDDREVDPEDDYEE